MTKLGYTWYSQDFISDPEVMMMTPSQRGIYRDLIDLAYKHDNKIPYTIEQMVRYTNSSEDEVKDILNMKGKKDGEFWCIPSCQKRIDKAGVSRKNGAKGGRPKTQNKPNNKPTEKPKPNPERKAKRKRKRNRNRNRKERE